MKRLAGMTALVGVGAIAFRTIDGSVEHEIDLGLLTYIATVYTIGIVVMLVYTRQWSLIGCGLLATMTGDALLYSRLGHLPVPREPWMLDIARSSFAVGGTYLLIGLVVWAREQRKDDATLAREPTP